MYLISLLERARTLDRRPARRSARRGGCVLAGSATRCCPWHGSTFRVSDGTVARGPATAPQPVFRTRIADGNLQACLPGAG
jgi:hypothetical protein